LVGSECEPIRTVYFACSACSILKWFFFFKLILFILWSRFKVDEFNVNSVHDFTLFKFLKDVSTLTLFKPLDASTLNTGISFEMDSIYFIKLNVENPIRIQPGLLSSFHSVCDWNDHQSSSLWSLNRIYKSNFCDLPQFCCPKVGLRRKLGNR